VHYAPADLEQLCLAGDVAWGRLAVGIDDEDDAASAAGERHEARRRRSAPTRSAPLAFFLRENLADLLAARPEGRAWLAQLSPAAAEVYEHLERRGASFLADVARAVRRLPTEVEDALWELVACGLVTGDGVAGLRTLLLPEEKRHDRPRHLRMLPSGAGRRAMPVGRWSLLGGEAAAEGREDEQVEKAARRLLRRWGVVFRELLAREKHAPRWRSLLHVLRRLEARGEVRGGRFVAGFVGEQFALPDAVEALRAVRRRKDDHGPILVAAADPLNLAGIVISGARVSPFSGQVIAWIDGLPAEVGELGFVLSRLQQHPATRAP
jgi:ATP-dependent Lhr-like helicase